MQDDRVSQRDEFFYYKIFRMIIIGLCGAIFGGFFILISLALHKNWSIGNMWQSDFFAIWSYARFIFSKPLYSIYDNDILLEFQRDLGACPTCLQPYAYPPFFLFFIFPLGVFSYYLASLLWTVGTASFYFVVSIERRQPRYAALLTIFAPATVASFSTGQTGLLASALIVGGFRVVTTRPVLGGLLFGLAAFKPQLGILIPIALISARLWRTVAAACVTIFVLVLASGIAFGWSMWSLWVEKLIPHADWVLSVKDRYNPTITSSLLSIGVGLPVARGVQSCIAVFVAIVIWMCFRRGVTRLATASLLVGTFLATPYAIVYDMPLLTNAVLFVLRDEEESHRALAIPELIVLALSLVLPVIMVATWRPALLRSIPLILLFGLVVWRTLPFRSHKAQNCRSLG